MSAFRGKADMDQQLLTNLDFMSTRSSSCLKHWDLQTHRVFVPRDEQVPG